MKNEYTPKEVSALMGVTPRQITDMCVQGRFPGAWKDKTSQKKWHIPGSAVAEALAARESEVEVLPPEGLELVSLETAKSFVEGIVQAALAEVVKKDTEVIEELRNQLEELSQWTSEEGKDLQKRITELSNRLTEVDKKKLEEVEEVKKKSEELRKENTELRQEFKEEVQRKSEEVAEALEERDRRLLEVMRALLEEKKKRPWWRRLFT